MLFSLLVLAFLARQSHLCSGFWNFRPRIRRPPFHYSHPYAVMAQISMVGMALSDYQNFSGRILEFATLEQPSETKVPELQADALGRLLRTGMIAPVSVDSLDPRSPALVLVGSSSICSTFCIFHVCTRLLHHCLWLLFGPGARFHRKLVKEPHWRTSEMDHHRPG